MGGWVGGLEWGWVGLESEWDVWVGLSRGGEGFGWVGVVGCVGWGLIGGGEVGCWDWVGVGGSRGWGLVVYDVTVKCLIDFLKLDGNFDTCVLTQTPLRRRLTVGRNEKNC